MQMMKKVLSLFLALLMLLSFAACEKGDNPGKIDGTSDPSSTQAPQDGENSSYVVSVKSMSGTALSGINVYVYGDEKLTDLQGAAKTDNSGNASFELPLSENYFISLDGVPKGYVKDAYYKFTGTSAAITLSTELISDESLSETQVALGDVMRDFTVTSTDGEEIKLSEVLKEKKAVMLNFWYTTCSWCLKEFPYMEEAYQMYNEDVEIIALNPYGEGASVIKAFKEENNLSFIMAECPAAWATAFGITAYPTSVIIDRYGVVCLIESGALTTLRPFTSMFDHFISGEYTQKLCENGVADLVTQVKPDATMPSSEEISAVISTNEENITYRAEEDEYTWPFVLTEKDGVPCVKASNSEVESSYAIMYADVQLKAGQAVAVEYMVSSEAASDIMHIIVDGSPIFQISGVNETAVWETCYPCVAVQDGTYKVALCYIKDESENAGDDTVFVKNIKIVDASEIDTDTFLPREAAVLGDDEITYEYVEIVYNPADKYYHVGSSTGPLLLADLMGTTQFNTDDNMYNVVTESTHTVGDVLLSEAMMKYFTLASNSSLSGFVPVTEELLGYLKEIDSFAGFDSEDDREWMKLCSYYQSYGPDGNQLEDPIKGLATFSSFTATLGKDVETNYFYYDRVIMPRGMYAKFIPETSGVYRITSKNDSVEGVDGWIFDENQEILYTYEFSERMYDPTQGELSMVYYLEAGTEYYIDIAFWDLYEIGYIYYDIEYLAPTMELFRLCSPGYFTYDTNATGELMYAVIAGGIKAVLGDDGYYYEDLGNGKKGSLIYADFTGITAIFDKPIATVPAYDDNGNPIYDDNGDPSLVKGMIDLKGFDFSKTEDDLYVLAFVEKHNGDVEAAEEDLKAEWGENFEAYKEDYQLEDVFAGKYHGEGEDLTADISEYLDKIITDGPVERQGCVPVDEELAELLQKVMDKYTFEDVDQSWLKLCYYYDYLGPEAGK